MNNRRQGAAAQEVDVLTERDRLANNQPGLVQSYEEFLRSFGRYRAMKKQFDAQPEQKPQFKAQPQPRD